MKNLIVLLGPTAVGKTCLSLDLARFYDTPIISADSRQIFRELPIGTAAPTKQEQELVQHYFIGTHSIQEYYSAAKYEQDAINTINKIFQNNDTALLTGGSMLYIDAVCKGIDDIPTISDEIRNEIKKRLEREGIDILLYQLKKLDPEHYKIIDKKNPRRICHAVEICLQTGKTYTSFRKKNYKKRPFNIIKIGLNTDRDKLYDKINNRVLQMIDSGLIEEAKELYHLRHLNALKTVGYKELFSHFDGTISKDEAIRQIQSHTREYLRKQLTWFKKDDSIKWFSPNNINDIIRHISCERK